MHSSGRARAELEREQARALLVKARRSAAEQEANRIANLPESKDPCEYASGRVDQGWSDFKDASYQASFDDAVKGLAVDERCDNDDQHQLNEGFWS